jgi:phage terminase large subunit-like protein
MIADAFHDTIERYIDGVMSGEIVASRAVKACVERHLRDLGRQSTTDFPYHFDVAHAAKVCRFYPQVLRHSIGRYAGMPFELEPWQMFCESVIFGWKRDADETRRFRRAYESVGRKNGKSTRGAGRAIFLARYDHNPVAAAKMGRVFVPEPVSQVVLCATKKEQAERVVYAEIERMRRASSAISRGSTDIRRQLRFQENDGEIICVGSDKPYDGLNPHGIVMDEIHAWCEYHRPFYDTMLTGSGFRDQPLLSYLTTAGSDRSYLWLEIYKYCKQVLEGTVVDESVFAFIAELDEGDDIFDESLWIKANPNLGVSVGMDYLREQAREAKASAIAASRFTRYHCNRIVTSTEKAIDIDLWDKCEGELSDWKTADVICGGVDLGSRDDLAAYAFCARFPIDERDGIPVYRFEIVARAYVSDETTRDLSKQPFAEWIYREKLKRRQYAVLALRDDLIDECNSLDVGSVAYDPYNAQSLGEELTKEGIMAVRMAQNCTQFNEPIRDFLLCLTDGRLRHDGNELLRWAANNAAITKDRSDRWMFDKRSSSEKIDPIVAVVMAFRLCSLAPARATGSLFII